MGPAGAGPGPPGAPAGEGQNIDRRRARGTLSPPMVSKSNRVKPARTRPSAPAVASGARRVERTLWARIAALEDRVARLETGRSLPGDGRNAAPVRRAVTRCPGCGLPLRRKAGRCAECGRPLSSF